MVNCDRDASFQRNRDASLRRNRTRPLFKPIINWPILSLMMGLGCFALVPNLSAQPSQPRVTLQRRGTQFTDLTTNHPASIYITKLAEAGVIKGFPDGSFRPEAPVTRAQFAAILRQAFPAAGRDSVNPVPFADVPTGHWATEAIQIARGSGFLAGYPNNQFRPEQQIPRVQALVSLNNGLGYVAGSTNPDVLSHYQDTDVIPDYAIASLRSATQAGLVVSYPSLTQLQPNRNATRAEVSAFVYQAMAREGRIAAMADAPYLVQPSFATWSSQPEQVIPLTGSVQLSGNGDRLLIAIPEGFQVWNHRTGQRLAAVDLGNRRLQAPVGSTKDIAINPTGTRVAAVTQTTSSSQLRLELWDASTGQRLWQVPVGDSAGAVQGRSGSISAKTVMFRPGDDEILVELERGGGGSGSLGSNRRETVSLQLHDVQTGNARFSFDTTPGASFREIAFDPQGNRMIGYRQQDQGGGFNSQILDVWSLVQLNLQPNAQSGAIGQVPLQQSVVLPKNTLGFVDLTFASNGSLRVLSQHLYDVRLDDWNLDEGQRLQSTRGIGDVDRTDALGLLSPDGEFYFVRSEVAGTRLISTKNYKSMPLEAIARDASFDGQGEVLAIATPTQVEIFRKIVP